MRKVAKTAGDALSCGWKFTGVVRLHRTSWRKMVGGFGDAESTMFPSAEMARAFGGEAWSCHGGRSMRVGM